MRTTNHGWLYEDDSKIKVELTDKTGEEVKHSFDHSNVGSRLAADYITNRLGTNDWTLFKMPVTGMGYRIQTKKEE